MDPELEGIRELYTSWQNGSMGYTEHNMDRLGQALENLLIKYDKEVKK